MEHAKALAIKSGMTLIGLLLVLTAGFGVSFGTVLVMTIVLGAVSYPLGDLKLFPKSTNMIASTADTGVAFLIIWIIGMSMAGNAVTGWPWVSLLAAVVIGAAEFFFHLYIAKKPLGDNKKLHTAPSH
ncbi:DUF2512 family protein [Halobacillus massiliensis]|uniref:DUF2512 family protein n=1 Tax=Halobacillus massiliensis TaxID=1926286 RepID=UPI0009E39279|nr:DUF2512 family protein [Halobacillus massiliensis]